MKKRATANDKERERDRGIESAHERNTVVATESKSFCLCFDCCISVIFLLLFLFVWKYGLCGDQIKSYAKPHLEWMNECCQRWFNNPIVLNLYIHIYIYILYLYESDTESVVIHILIDNFVKMCAHAHLNRHNVV